MVATKALPAALDLGSAYTRFSYFDRTPHRIPSFGDMPSLVGVTPNGSVICGRDAEKLQLERPERVQSVLDCLTGEPIKLGGVTFPPGELVGRFLNYCTGYAESLAGTAVEISVLGVPNRLRPSQLQLLRTGCRSAGLARSTRLLSPAVLTALEYVWVVKPAAELKFVVCSLGASGMELACVTSSDGVLEVLSSLSTDAFGGNVYTHLLALTAAERHKKATGEVLPGDDATQALLRVSVEHAKRVLTSTDPVRVVLPGTGARFAEITRQDLSMITREFSDSLTAQFARLLGDAQLAPEAIDRVLLCGGVTEIPDIGNVLRERLNRPLHILSNACTCAADGGAIYAALQQGLALEPLLLNVTAHTYTVRTQAGSAVLRLVKNTTRPTALYLDLDQLPPGTQTLELWGDEELMDELPLNSLSFANRFGVQWKRLKLSVDGAGTVTLTVEEKPEK